jgi:hypothetical protein
VQNLTRGTIETSCEPRVRISWISRTNQEHSENRGLGVLLNRAYCDVDRPRLDRRKLDLAHAVIDGLGDELADRLLGARVVEGGNVPSFRRHVVTLRVLMVTGRCWCQSLRAE